MKATRTGAWFLLFALAVNAALVATMGVGDAHACSCAGGSSPVAESKSSAAVFVGEAVENGLEDPEPVDGAQFGGIRFDVSRTWKGAPEGSVVLYGQSPSYYGPLEEGKVYAASSCAVDFTRGETYLVYASRTENGGFLQANACGRTGPLENAEKDLKTLGAPSGELPDTGGPGWSRLSVLAVFGVVAFAVSVGGISTRRRA